MAGPQPYFVVDDPEINSLAGPYKVPTFCVSGTRNANQVPPPDPTLSISSLYIENLGGYTSHITGSNFSAGNYQIHVGPNGDATDPLVYNGIPGSGGTDVIFDLVSGVIVKTRYPLFFPPLPVGGPYTLTFVPQPSGSTFTIPSIVTVVGESFSERTLNIRRYYPDWLACGVRSPSVKVFPQT